MKTISLLAVSLLLGCSTRPSTAPTQPSETGAARTAPRGSSCFAPVFPSDVELLDLAAFHLRGTAREDSELEVVASLHTRAFVKVGEADPTYLRLLRSEEGWVVSTDPWSDEDDDQLTLLEAVRQLVPADYLVAEMFTFTVDKDREAVKVKLTHAEQTRHIFEHGPGNLVFSAVEGGWALTAPKAVADIVWIDEEEQRIADLLQTEQLSLRGLESGQNMRFEDDVLHYVKAADCAANRRDLYVQVSPSPEDRASVFSVPPSTFQRRVDEARTEATDRFERTATPRRPAISGVPQERFFYDESGALQRGEVLTIWNPGSDPSTPEGWTTELRRYNDGHLGRTRALEAHLSLDPGALVWVGAGNKAEELWSQFHETNSYSSQAVYNRGNVKCGLAVEAEWNGGAVQLAASWTVKVLRKPENSACAVP